jgi:hypothetical protein
LFLDFTGTLMPGSEQVGWNVEGSGIEGYQESGWRNRAKKGALDKRARP